MTQSASPTEQCPGMGASETIMPPNDGGFFVRNGIILPKYTHGLERLGWDEENMGALQTVVDECGTTTNYVAEMEDGSTHRVMTINPRNPSTTTALTGSTAWYTRVDDPYNLGWARTIASRLRIPVVLVGSPGSAKRTDDKKEPTPSLVLTAYNIQRIGDVVLERMGVRVDELIVRGDSQSAMSAPAMDIPEIAKGRTTVMRDLTDPCNPEECSIGDYVRIASHVPHELGAMAIATLSNRGINHFKLAGMLKPDWHFLKHASRAAPSLFNGSAGDVAKASADDIPTHIVSLVKNQASKPSTWEQIYEGRPHFRLVRLNGYHMAIPHGKILEYQIARLAALLDGRGPSESLRGFDAGRVFDAKPRRDEEQSPELKVAA